MRVLIVLALSVLTFAGNFNVVTPALQIGEILEFTTYRGQTPSGASCSVTLTKDYYGSVLVKAQESGKSTSALMDSAAYGHLRADQRLFRWSGKGHFLTRMLSDSSQFFAVEDEKGSVVECEASL